MEKKFRDVPKKKRRKKPKLPLRNNLESWANLCVDVTSFPPAATSLLDGGESLYLIEEKKLQYFLSRVCNRWLRFEFPKKLHRIPTTIQPVVVVNYKKKKKTGILYYNKHDINIEMGARVIVFGGKQQIDEGVEKMTTRPSHEY